MTLSRSEAELRRLKDGPDRLENPGGVGTVCFRGHCPDGAHAVLARVTEVLTIVGEASRHGWPTLEEWRASLPAWFTSACIPEASLEEAERWLAWWKTLPVDQQASEADKHWTLDGWLYWMEPAHRQWFWWSAEIPEESSILLTVEVEGWPFPWGCLRWLFKAAGATLESQE